eukprot:3378547-Amphidinium_carterae.1
MVRVQDDHGDGTGNDESDVKNHHDPDSSKPDDKHVDKTDDDTHNDKGGDDEPGLPSAQRKHFNNNHVEELPIMFVVVNMLEA